MLPGDHFFLQPCQPLLLQGLGRDLLQNRGTPQAAESPQARAPRWRPPAVPPPLGNSDVHVWRIPLDQPEDCRRGLQQYLNEDEQERARRFYFPRDRERFVVCRGTLRVLLGRYLSCHPGRLRFDYGPYGKPVLADEAEADGLRFNVAHSEGLALIAVALDREVGVDLEHLRPEMATEQIALRFFSPREMEALRAVPPQARKEAFFHCWTRKEAYLKATGTGLATALDRFDVSLAPGEPAALLGNRDDPREARRWSLWELAPGPGFVGALAVEGTPRRFWFGEWSAAPGAPAAQARGASPQWPAFTPAGGAGRRPRRGDPVAATGPRDEKEGRP
jgi:4'-phosphopantetheinyl transferase